MEALINKIKNNIQYTLEKIQKASDSCDREPQSIKLIVVTKSQPINITEAAILAGAKFLGENYPQEAEEKIVGLKKYMGIEWHMIGHLQSRKSRIVSDHFNWLQSLDSVRLAEKLDRILESQQKTMPVLLECNVSGEGTKSGFPAWQEDHWAELLPDIALLNSLTHLEIKGLMTMPPLFESPEQVRPYFIRLRKLQAYLSKQFPDGKWGELSMGTSADFEVAIQEGATFIRIGQAILGPRP